MRQARTEGGLDQDEDWGCRPCVLVMCGKGGRRELRDGGKNDGKFVFIIQVWVDEQAVPLSLQICIEWS